MARTKNRYRKETIIEEVSLQTYRTGISFAYPKNVLKPGETSRSP